MINAEFRMHEKSEAPGSGLKPHIHVEDGFTGALAEVVMMFGAIINSLAGTQDENPMTLCDQITPLLPSAVMHMREYATVTAISAEREAGDDG